MAQEGCDHKGQGLGKEELGFECVEFELPERPPGAFPIERFSFLRHSGMEE